MSVDVLFLSPHPDDVELFCGGTVARLSALGRRVQIADLTAGELASNGTVESRRDASLRAAEVLGALRDRPVLGLPDGGLRAQDDEQMRAIVELLRSVRPRLLFVPWPRDRHPDHVAGGELARRALFFAGLRSHAGGGAPHSVARTIYYPCHHDAPVNFCVDVGGCMDRWRSALACYADQFDPARSEKPTPINRPEFLPSQEARRREWGRRGGCTFAEAFVVEGLPLVGDPLDFIEGEALQ